MDDSKKLDSRGRELQMLQSLPLSVKIKKSQLRIREFYDRFNGKVYISASGGQHATVLTHIVRSMYSANEIEAVFCKTRQEYPEIYQYIKTVPNLKTIYPKTTFKKIILDRGYPVVSKEQSGYIRDILRIKDRNCKLYQTRMYGNKYGRGKVSNCWKYLLDAPFKISNDCCYELKKKPFIEYEKQSGKVPFIGTLAEESELRKTSWKLHGCNAYDLVRPHSAPLSFWTQKDIMQYIKFYNLPYAACYGEMIEHNRELIWSGTQRTGCIYCLYGIQYEQYLPGGNRIQKLHDNYPKLYEYGIKEYGIDKVLSYMGIDYQPKGSFGTDRKGQTHIIIY